MTLEAGHRRVKKENDYSTIFRKSYLGNGWPESSENKIQPPPLAPRRGTGSSALRISTRRISDHMWAELLRGEILRAENKSIFFIKGVISCFRRVEFRPKEFRPILTHFNPPCESRPIMGRNSTRANSQVRGSTGPNSTGRKSHIAPFIYPHPPLIQISQVIHASISRRP